MGVVVVALLHWKFKWTQMLAYQAAQLLVELFYHPLVQIHLLGQPAWSKCPLGSARHRPPAPGQGAPGCSSAGWHGAPWGEVGPRGAQPRPRVLELAPSEAAHFPASDHSGKPTVGALSRPFGAGGPDMAGLLAGLTGGAPAGSPAASS